MTTVAEPITTIPEVERGAAWLDENVPGWWERIDLETLDLERCDLCVSGQLALGPIFVEEREGVVGIRTSYPAHLGMDSWSGTDFPELQRAWEEEILRRREAA